MTLELRSSLVVGRWSLARAHAGESRGIPVAPGIRGPPRKILRRSCRREGTWGPSTSFGGAFHFVRLAPHFGQDDSGERDQRLNDPRMLEEGPTRVAKS
jgi:hypothetical protein